MQLETSLLRPEGELVLGRDGELAADDVVLVWRRIRQPRMAARHAVAVLGPLDAHVGLGRLQRIP